MAIALRFEHIPEGMKEEIRSALSEWVSSLSDEEARSPVIQLLGAPALGPLGSKQSYAPCYSPTNIRDEVVQETDFGKQYVEALYELHERMKLRSPEASIITLIRRSVRQNSLQHQ